MSLDAKANPIPLPSAKTPLSEPPPDMPDTPDTVAAPALAISRLVIIARDGGEGASFPLKETTDIGRIEGDVLLGEDRYVSPRHARITKRGSSYFLRDLGSTNGIYIRIPGGIPGTSLPGLEGCRAGEASEEAGRRASPQPPAGGAGSMGSSHEIPLRDQDLFLVGQQVLRFEIVRDAEDGLGSASEHGTLLFGTPSSPRYARLSQRTVEGVARDLFYIRKAETVLGRESGDIVFTDDPFVSRRHAIVRRERDRFVLMDLGSSNGTFLQLHEEVKLNDGDHFRIGQQLFRVDLERASLSDALSGSGADGSRLSGPGAAST